MTIRNAGSRHVLYRFYSQTEELLYVGITMNPNARWRGHEADKEWWLDVRRIQLEPFADRASVLCAERVAVQAEQPKYNILLAKPGPLWRGSNGSRTPIRGVRASDDIWIAAKAKAKDRGETISDVVRRELEDYVRILP